MDANPQLTTEQLKKLIADHSVRENLKALLKQSQIISELAGKLRKEANKLISGEIETLDQTQLLKDLEQLRIAKSYMRGIRFANFYHVLNGEEPRSNTTEPFEVEKWLRYQAKKAAQQQEHLAERENSNRE
jgi:flagellin-specific chaperone FliS